MTQQRVPGLTRRALLGGGAVAVTLPFLESFEPRAARAQTAVAKRLIYYYVPNGIHMATFRPTTTGTGYTLPSMLASLAPLKGDFSVITGLENVNAKPDVAGDHASGTSAFITCAKALKSETNISLGISADQIAAAKIGSATRIPSLQLGMAGGASSGGCDSGYGCAYARNISWSSATTPLPKLTDPAKVFDQLFAGANPMESTAAADKRRAYNKSVLDTVTQEAGSLKLKLGRTDQLKVDQYLNGVRELERRINAAAPSSTAACVAPMRPANAADFPAKLKVMTDLMVLAVQCDATRIITFMLGNALSGQTYPALGITRGHHDISHHASNAENLAMLDKIGKWEVEQLGYLMTRLKEIPEGETNALYNSTIFWSSDISDGNRHNHDDMPILLAGHGGGALKPGRHISYAKAAKEKVANLLLTTLSTVGVTDAKLGDSAAPLADI